MAVKVKNNLTKWALLVFIGGFAYLSGYLYGNRTHNLQAQREIQLRHIASQGSSASLVPVGKAGMSSPEKAPALQDLKLKKEQKLKTSP